MYDSEDSVYGWKRGITRREVILAPVSVVIVLRQLQLKDSETRKENSESITVQRGGRPKQMGICIPRN